jgi:hypothetical protein
VFGKVTDEVTELAFESGKTGVRYRTPVRAEGAFSVRLPPGRYGVELRHDGPDFTGSVPGLAIDVPAGIQRFEASVCRTCRVVGATGGKQPEVDLDPSRRGALRGTIRFPAGTSAKVATYPGVVSLSSVSTDYATSSTVIEAGSFEFKGVPYGKYRIAYRSQLRFPATPDAPSLTAAGAQTIDPNLPVGQYQFEEPVEIGPGTTTTSWVGDVQVQPVDIQVQFNGKDLADNGVGKGTRGHLTLRSTHEWNVDGLSLGAKGPGRFRVAMLTGRYELAIESYQGAGHGVLESEAQDVLPSGAVALGAWDIVKSDAPTVIRINLGVRPVLFDVEAAPRPVTLDLKNARETYVWADLPAQKAKPTLAYTGCFAVTPSDGPSRGGFGEVEGETFWRDLHPVSVALASGHSSASPSLEWAPDDRGS